MLRHIFTIIYNQRKQNIFIFLELLLVACLLWAISDSLCVDIYTEKQPMGVDIESVYELHLSVANEAALEDSSGYRRVAEDFLKLVDNVRQCPEVEAASVSMSAVPYTWTSNWSYLIAASDTTTPSDLCQMFFVMPEYFQVLHIQTPEGRPVYDEAVRNPGEFILSQTLAEKLFPGVSAVGREAKYGNFGGESEIPRKIASVTAPRRKTDFERAEPMYYVLWRSDKEFLDRCENNSFLPTAFDLLVRMRPNFQPSAMADFLQKNSVRLSSDNIYVSSYTPLSKYKTDMLKGRIDNQKKKTALVVFLMVNIFFGIIGTFWLRTQSRRAEIGLRAALGASKQSLQLQLYLEGLVLLALTLPLTLIFIGNMLLADLPDTYRLDYTWWRFVFPVIGSYLLLSAMILVGISFPARKIARMNPAETLHYE